MLNPLGSPSARLLGVVPAFVLLLSCSQTDGGGALGVTVRVGEAVKAECVRVWVRTQEGAEQVTGPIDREGRVTLEVAIYPTSQLQGDVQVGARGYLGPGCETAAVLNEESDAVNAVLSPTEVTRGTVMLEAVPAAFDKDGDGWRAGNAGGADCNDEDGSVYPGALEICSDGRDNDCNGQSDCEDATCQGHSCEDGNLCSAASACQNFVCTATAAVTCEQSENPCRQAVGTCSPAQNGCHFAALTGQPCEGGLCGQDGTCIPAGAEVDCANGQDDNGIDGTDCEDPTCDARACDPQDLCRPQAVCTAGACDPGPVKACEAPPSECHQPAGACDPGTGDCTYSLKPAGSACSSGECLADGACVPSETGADCHDGQDNDADGFTDCEDPSCSAQPCDPGNLCIADQVCDANAGTCSGGTPVMCNPPECHAVGTPECDPLTGCNFVVTPGAACATGFCSAAGVCVAPFSYTPSNFDPLLYGPSVRAAPLNFTCSSSDPNVGPAYIDTNPAASQVFNNWCNQPEPQLFPVTLSNGLEAVVVPLQGLTVGAGAALGAVGPRPVIFAVYGDATIHGYLGVPGYVSFNGAGVSETVCGSSWGGDGVSNGSTTNGGGGGGGFATSGGGGGNAASSGGGSRGEAVATPDYLLSPLRGGCQGGLGGSSQLVAGNPPTISGIPGGGGGALQLSASGTLSVQGVVSANGGGAAGGRRDARGGGGGGSGGGLLLEGDAVVFGNSAVVTVAGGGGGEGGDGSNDGDRGDNGRDSTSQATAASGGSGLSNGGDGGNGAFAASAAGAGDGTGAGTGGGGGGGGLGVIRVNAASGCVVNGSASFRGHVSSSGMSCPCSGGTVNHGVCVTP